MARNLATSSLLVYSILSCSVLGENLTFFTEISILDHFPSFTEDFSAILNRVKTIAIAIDGDYYESGDFLGDLVPVVKHNHSVMVYYFSWDLDEQDLCFSAWRDEILQRFYAENYRRRKRSSAGMEGSLSDFQDSWFRTAITGYIVIVSLEMLPNAIDCLVDPLGIYLILLDVDATEEVLEKVYENIMIAWEVERSYEVYVMLHNDTLTIHPFMRNPLRNNSFGVLMNFRERPENFIKNMNGYPLRIEMFHSAFNYLRINKTTGVKYFEGTDAEAMRALRVFMNFTAIFQQPDGDMFGYKLPNGSFTGTLGRISTRKSDLALTGFFVKDYSNPDMEFTMPVYLDELCCVVQKAKQIPKYWIPLLCFHEYVWFCLLLSILASSSFWRAIRWCEERMFPDKELLIQLENQSSRKTLQLFIDTTIIFISSPLRRHTRVTSERMFIASVLMMSVVVVAIFQSNLSTAFTRPIYYRDITSLAALDKANLKIGVKYKGMLDDLFPPEDSELNEHLRHQIKIVDLLSIPLIEMVMKDPSLATVTRKSTVKLENAKYFHTGKVFLVPECPKMYNLAYVLPKNSVFFKQINFVMLHLDRGGFMGKWIQEMNWNTTWLNRRRLGFVEEEKFRIYDFVDFQLPFYVLLIGSVISFLVLLVEIYKSKKAKK
ncbi:uncharacterized protein LOC132255633 [Phlebotomus argentipes]|uniref:uncharacterized protein LOC132255633 n=1 Tax=Phlebotomus argentipes TaxID=94469 RepID=UPI002892A415|nr:uncharacterized protein LOC132255633 [Phlebotomus argentipes]